MPILTLPASKGGDLATSLPLDQIGLANWSDRTNWRFKDGQEVLREGDVFFNRQDPLDTGELIEGIFHARHPDGTPVIFLCTKSSIYRFLAEDGELGYFSETEDGSVYQRQGQGALPVFGEWAGIYVGTANDYIFLSQGNDQRKIYSLGNWNGSSGDNNKSPRYKVTMAVTRYDPLPTTPAEDRRTVGSIDFWDAAPNASLSDSRMWLNLTYTGKTDPTPFEEWSAISDATSTTSELRLPDDWSEFKGIRVNARIGQFDLEEAKVGDYNPTGGYTPVIGGTWSGSPVDADTQSAQVSVVHPDYSVAPFSHEPINFTQVRALFDPGATDLGDDWYADPVFGVVYIPSDTMGYVFLSGAWVKIYGQVGADTVGFYDATREAFYTVYRDSVSLPDGVNASFIGHLAQDTWDWFEGTPAQFQAGTERIITGLEYILGASSVVSADWMVEELTFSGPTYTLKLSGDWTTAYDAAQEMGVGADDNYTLTLLTSRGTTIIVNATRGAADPNHHLGEDFGYATTFTFQATDVVSGLGDLERGDIPLGMSSRETNAVVVSVRRISPSEPSAPEYVEDTGLPVFRTSSNFTWARVNPAEDPANPLSAQYLFGTQGSHRWQMVDVDGYAVFNNGYDLPFVYDLSDTSTYRGHLLYELRENGYAFCDTMSTLGGVLTFQDVAELTDTQTQLEKGNTAFHRLRPLGYNLTEGHGAYGPVRGDSSTTPPYARIRYQLIGSPFNNPERWGAGVAATATSGSATLTTPYRMLSWEVNTSKNLKVLAAGDPVADTPAYANGTVYAAGDLVHYLNDLYQALEDGTADNADPNAGSLLFKNLGALPAYDLQTTITSGPTWDSSNSVWQWAMADTAGATATDQFTYNPDIDSLAPQPFAYKLQGDSSPIINAAELQDRLIIFKANSIYAGRLTNNAADPMAFERLYYGNESLFWKWTLVAVEGDFLFYAGRDKFYKLDLVRGTPQELPKLLLCDNIFFDSVDAAHMESTHASVNAPSSEVWVTVPPLEGEDPQTLCWSWVWDKCSTVDYSTHAASSVEVDLLSTPTYLYLFSRREDRKNKGGVFVYGLASHNVKLLGDKSQEFTRGGAYSLDEDSGDPVLSPGATNPTASLASGAGVGGERGNLLQAADPYKDYHEGLLGAYQLVLGTGSDKSTAVKVSLNGFHNPADDPEPLLEVELPTAEVDSNMPVHYLSHGFQDVIKVDTGKFVSISKRVFDIQLTESRSAARTEEG